LPGNGIPSKLTAMNTLRTEVTGTAWKTEAPVRSSASEGEAVTDDQPVAVVG
jgi:hypothetical protein